MYFKIEISFTKIGMNSPAKTASGTPCKRCKTKGEKCFQHGGTPKSRTSPKKTPSPRGRSFPSSPKKSPTKYELLTQEDWEREKYKNELMEKVMKIKRSPSPRKSPRRSPKSSPKKLRSPRGKPEPTDEYETDIIDFLKMRERKFPISPDYIKEKTMPGYENKRSIMADWLIEVAEEYRQTNKTLHLAVTLMDRYMTRVQVQVKDFQLVSCACILISSKYEEVPQKRVSVDDMQYISGGLYDRKAIIDMESRILGVLQYDITHPTCIDFAEFYQDALGLEPKHKAMSNYVMDASMIDVNSYSHLPSLVAAASIYYSNLALRRSDGGKTSPKSAWTTKMERITGYTIQEVRAVVPDILKWLNPKSKYQAVFLKYSRSANHQVASISLVDI